MTAALASDVNHMPLAAAAPEAVGDLSQLAPGSRLSNRFVRGDGLLASGRRHSLPSPAGERRVPARAGVGKRPHLGRATRAARSAERCRGAATSRSWVVCFPCAASPLDWRLASLPQGHIRRTAWRATPGCSSMAQPRVVPVDRGARRAARDVRRLQPASRSHAFCGRRGSKRPVLSLYGARNRRSGATAGDPGASGVNVPERHAQSRLRQRASDRRGSAGKNLKSLALELGINPHREFFPRRQLRVPRDVRDMPGLGQGGCPGLGEFAELARERSPECEGLRRLACQVKVLGDVEVTTFAGAMGACARRGPSRRRPRPTVDATAKRKPRSTPPAPLSSSWPSFGRRTRERACPPSVSPAEGDEEAAEDESAGRGG